MKLQRVEIHKIKKDNSFYQFFINYCVNANNLYNHANYIIRQKFIETTKLKEQGLLEHAEWIRYNELDKLLKQDKQFPDYYTLPNCQVSQAILKLVDKNWKSFFESIKKWKKNPNAFTGRPKLPKYRKKQEPFMLIIPSQKACKIKNNKLVFTKKAFNSFLLNTICQNQKGFDKINQVRILPKQDYLKIEVIYSIEIKDELNKNIGNILSIDIGVDNLATITTNQNLKPIIINGKPLKSINHYFNKQKAYLTSKLKKCQNKETSKKLQRLSIKRENKINDYLHKASQLAIDYCKLNKIGYIIIGHSNFWKQNINTGKINNQTFVSIPFNKFFQMIEYKATQNNIYVSIQEESYTSKASYFDNDKIPVWNKGQNKSIQFSGKRIKRGLYRTKNGFLVNADINGSLNIMRKVSNDVERPVSKGLVANPVVINLSDKTFRKMNKELERSKF